MTVRVRPDIRNRKTRLDTIPEEQTLGFEDKLQDAARVSAHEIEAVPRSEYRAVLKRTLSGTEGLRIDDGESKSWVTRRLPGVRSAFEDDTRTQLKKLAKQRMGLNLLEELLSSVNATTIVPNHRAELTWTEVLDENGAMDSSVGSATTIHARVFPQDQIGVVLDRRGNTTPQYKHIGLAKSLIQARYAQRGEMIDLPQGPETWRRDWNGPLALRTIVGHRSSPYSENKFRAAHGLPIRRFEAGIATTGLSRR